MWFRTSSQADHQSSFRTSHTETTCFELYEGPFPVGSSEFNSIFLLLSSFGVVFPFIVSRWTASIFPRFYIFADWWAKCTFCWLLLLELFLPYLAGFVSLLNLKIYCSSSICSSVKRLIFYSSVGFCCTLAIFWAYLLWLVTI